MLKGHFHRIYIWHCHVFGFIIWPKIGLIYPKVLHSSRFKYDEISYIFLFLKSSYILNYSRLPITIISNSNPITSLPISWQYLFNLLNFYVSWTYKTLFTHICTQLWSKPSTSIGHFPLEKRHLHVMSCLFYQNTLFALLNVWQVKSSDNNPLAKKLYFHRAIQMHSFLPAFAAHHEFDVLYRIPHLLQLH